MNDLSDQRQQTAEPGRPRGLIILGAAVTFMTLIPMFIAAYQSLWSKTIPVEEGMAFLLQAAPFHIAGILMICFGYTRYDFSSAMVLSAIVLAVSGFIIFLGLKYLDLLPFLILGGIRYWSSRKRFVKTKRSSDQTEELYNPLLRSYWFKLFRSAKKTLDEITAELEQISVTCPFCRKSYLTTGERFICTNCGATTPQSFIDGL